MDLSLQPAREEPGRPAPLLFIEPRNEASFDPLIDSLTRRMTAALRGATQSDYAYCGIHCCSCGAHSGCTDLFLSDGTMINSLCVHYLAVHRDEVPADELERVHSLPYGEAEPDRSELQVPLRPPGFVRDVLAPGEIQGSRHTAGKYIDLLLRYAVYGGSRHIQLHLISGKIHSEMVPPGRSRVPAPPASWAPAIIWHLERIVACGHIELTLDSCMDVRITAEPEAGTVGVCYTLTIADC